MPFIGRDWRSPGEAWVKTETLGWQRMKLIESQLFPICCPKRIHTTQLNDQQSTSWPPQSEFGQHMAGTQATNNRTTTATDCDATSPKHPFHHCPAMVRHANNYHKRNSSCDTSPNSSSPSTSASVSPAGSPEKLSASNSADRASLSPSQTQYLHPIAISSPYGHYSCSCNNQRSHNASAIAKQDAGSNYGNDNTQQMHLNGCCRQGQQHNCANCIGQQKLHSLSNQSLSTVSSTSSSSSSNDDEATIINRKQEQINCDYSYRCCRHQQQTLGLRPNRSLQADLNKSLTTYQLDEGLDRQLDAKSCSSQTMNDHDSQVDNKRDQGLDYQDDRNPPHQLGRHSAPPQIETLSSDNVLIADSSRHSGIATPLPDRPTASLFKYETIQYDNPTENPASCTNVAENDDFQNHCSANHTDDGIPNRNTIDPLVCEQNVGTSISSGCDKNADNNDNTDRNFRTFTNCCCNGSFSPNNYQPNHFRSSDSVAQNPKQPPYCRISVRTREVAMYNTISEAFYRLDFYNAIHDIRRFNYICKLLHLLITQNLTTLSGCATKILFNMLEQVAWEVSSNKRNIHVIKNLLTELKQMIQKYYCWGRPIGSSLLWQQHFDTIQRINRIVEGIELAPPKSSEDQITFDKLPVEMVREILLRLNDYRDLVNSAQASPIMKEMINSQYIWKRMCRYHFTDQQVKLALKEKDRILTIVSNEGRRLSNSRGIKYARTSTADGRSSFRSRVTQNSSNENDDPPYSGTNRNKSTTIGNEVPPDQIHGTVSTQNIATTVKNTTTGSRCTQKSSQNGRKEAAKQSVLTDREQRPNQRDVNSSNGKQIHDSNKDIDWLSIFHHLRKRFDLKEEYADCLLFCRHCRCLFWKSFGHPCVTDEHHIDGHKSSRMNSPSDSAHHHPRPSVASLSKGFDNIAQQQGQRVAMENISQQANQNREAPRIEYNRQEDALLRRLHDRRVRLMNHTLEEANQENVNRSNRTENDLRTRGVYVPEHVTISPQAFLKFFSL